MSSFAGSNEGLSMVRPPLFKGTQFSWWKNKMEIFINSEDVDLWDIIVEGPKEVNNASLGADGKPVPKPRSAWSQDDKVLMGKNSKAIKMLLCALNDDEFTRISALKSAKEI